MTTIQSSPDAVGSTHEAAAGTTLADVAAWITTSDHKRIGRLFIGTSLLAAVASVVIGVLLGIERSDGTQTVLDAGSLPQLFQANRIGLVFGTMLPLSLGLAIAAVPLQVGARSIAFARLALAGFYGWLAGLVLVIVALADNGGIGGGNEDMVELFLAGHVVMGLGLLAAAGSVATTVLTTRAPGMTMRRVPLFSWSALVASIGLLLALPVMIGTCIYLIVDYRYARATFGGNEGIGDWIGWVFTQPTTYLFAVIAVGVFAELVPVAFRRRQPLRGLVLTGVGLVGTAAFAGVTQQDIHNLPWSGSGLNFDDFGQKFDDLVPFVAFNVLPLLGAVMVLLAVPLAARGGRFRITSPFMFGFFGLGMIVTGMLGWVLFAIDDLGLQGTVFEEGVHVYVAYGTVLAALGGITYWAPKLWGRTMSEKQALPLALLGTLATILASLPYFIAGFADQPAGTGLYDYSGPSTLWNVLVLAGHALMVLTLLAFVFLMLTTFRGDRDRAGDDPWDAHTLEWATTSPAPGNNFPEVPIVRSPEPLLDLKRAATPGSPS